MSTAVQKVLLLGGSGFIGSAVAEQLTARGYFVTVPTRNRERAKHLLILPTVDVVDADVHDPQQLLELVREHDAVINLIGILHGDFAREHVALPRLVAETCVAAGVRRLVQMSALNAGLDGPSDYLVSRGRGEAAVWAVAGENPSLRITVFQPSVVFGEHDRFFNMFADLVRLFPLIPLGSPEAQFQPVWVEDVARALAASITMSEAYGKTFPMVGPRVYTLRQLLEMTIAFVGKKRLVLGLGPGLSRLQATAFEFLPGKLITRDNLRSMSLPSTSATPFPAMFGAASSIDSVVGAYLQRSTGRARYPSFRDNAGR
ncbi:MAG TPA: complex I NDUFA9 subunit family protein [Usitatibacteraceae bacterium]